MSKQSQLVQKTLPRQAPGLPILAQGSGSSIPGTKNAPGINRSSRVRACELEEMAKLVRHGAEADLDDGATEDADGGARPGDVLVEAVEPFPRRLAGHEPRDMDHLAAAAAAKVGHLPPQRRLRPLRPSRSFLTRFDGGAGFGAGGAVWVQGWGDEAELRGHWRRGSADAAGRVAEEEGRRRTGAFCYFARLVAGLRPNAFFVVYFIKI
jgi:hypothetical protein